jgi:hypothetical protein
VKTYTHEELREVLRLHALWLQGDSAGTRANLLGADLRGADLSVADLSVANLLGADLRGANLRVANLSVANLSGANLRGANLSGANLRGADLRVAKLSVAGVLIPKIDHIDAQILRAISADGCRLEMATWHTCDTTHCRAGWVIQLAGDSGKAMEGLIGTGTAAALIYHMSRPGHAIPDWYASNEDALEDIKKHAALDPIPEVAK